jgi:hypothetical protein
MPIAIVLWGALELGHGFRERRILRTRRRSPDRDQGLPEHPRSEDLVDGRVIREHRELRNGLDLGHRPVDLDLGRRRCGRPVASRSGLRDDAWWGGLYGDRQEQLADDQGRDPCPRRPRASVSLPQRSTSPRERQAHPTIRAHVKAARRSGPRWSAGPSAARTLDGDPSEASFSEQDTEAAEGVTADGPRTAAGWQ